MSKWVKAVDGRRVPAISTEQMIEVDRLMIEDYGISLIQMMENAGRNLAKLSRRVLDGSVDNRKVIEQWPTRKNLKTTIPIKNKPESSPTFTAAFNDNKYYEAEHCVFINRHS